MADELFERMDKDHNDMISVDEFIKVFLEAEEVLNNKMQKISLSIRELEEEKNKLEYEYNQIVEVEKLNEYGIMFGSILNVTIVNAEHLNLHLKNSYDPYNVMTYCLLSCASRKFQTKFSDCSNPVWNESFSLYSCNKFTLFIIFKKVQFMMGMSICKFW